MAYKNVKEQKKANGVTIERCGNGYVVRPEYPSRSYDERADDNEVYVTIEKAMLAAKRMLQIGYELEKEVWVEEKSRY